MHHQEFDITLVTVGWLGPKNNGQQRMSTENVFCDNLYSV